MYRDIDFNLSKSNNNDVATFTSVYAINQSVQNILNTNVGELFYFPTFGCNIRQYVFEKVNIFTALAIRDEIKYALDTFEPRIRDIVIQVYLIPNNPNAIEVEISYGIASINIRTSQSLILRVA